MKKLTYLIAILVIFVFASCEKEDKSLDSVKWVEQKDRADTIQFKDGFLMLSRGKELKDGHLIPKIYSGPYSYKEQKGSIKLISALSSSTNFKMYSYKNSGDKLFIGDFYQKTPNATETLVFVKLK